MHSAPHVIRRMVGMEFQAAGNRCSRRDLIGRLLGDRSLFEMSVENQARKFQQFSVMENIVALWG